MHCCIEMTVHVLIFNCGLTFLLAAAFLHPLLKEFHDNCLHLLRCVGLWEIFPQNIALDRPTSYSDAEKILIEMIKLRKDFDIDDIKTMKDLTRKVPARYTKKLITWTVNARAKSNNPAALLSADEGVASLNPKVFVDALPEYKRRLLAKSIGIKPFSPVAVSSKELKKKLLAHPDLMDGIYKMIGN